MITLLLWTNFQTSIGSPDLSLCQAYSDLSNVFKFPVHAPPTRILLTGMCTIRAKIISRCTKQQIQCPTQVSGVGLCLELCTVRCINILNLTTYPIAPMTTKPTPTAWDILMNSRLSAKIHLQSAPAFLYEQPQGEKVALSRFVHRFMNCVPSLIKSLGISASSFSWSDMLKSMDWDRKGTQRSALGSLRCRLRGPDEKNFELQSNERQVGRRFSMQEGREVSFGIRRLR